MSDYNLIDVKNLTIDDQVLSIGEENPFLTKSDEITKILSSSVVTKIEVFPTNIDIPEGTIDSKSSLCSLFSWSEEKYDDQNFTGLKYINAVSACDTMFLQLYLYPKTLAETNMFIDWGDGNISSISKWSPAYEKYEYFKYYGNPYYYSEMIISHTYEEPYINRKNIVTIYGEEFFMMRGLYDSIAISAISRTGKFCQNIISRIFESDLPVHKRLKNVSSICNGSLKVLKIEMPYEYPHSLTNTANSFKSCRNLQYFDMDESSFDRFSLYACGSMFDGCSCLSYSNFTIPSFIGIGNSTNLYNNCINLSVDIKTLFPKTGFAMSRLNMSKTFNNCSSLFGIVPNYMNDPHQYNLVVESIGVTLTSQIPVILSNTNYFNWSTLPVIIDDIPSSLSDYISNPISAVQTLSNTISSDKLYRLTKNDVNCTFAKKSQIYKRISNNDSYEISDFLYIGTMSSDVYFLSTNALLDLSGNGNIIDYPSETTLMLDVVKFKLGSGSNTTRLVLTELTSDYDVIYLKNVWTSPDGIDYKAKCVYKIELSNDEYVYNNILDTSQLKSAYVLRNDDPIVDGHSGEVWKLSVNTISNYSNSTITYISSASNAIGNALSGCNESVLSSSPMYLGGYASNPVM